MKLFHIQIGLFICRINHLMSPPSPVCWWWPGCWCRHILTGAGRWCPLGGTWALPPAPWPRLPVSAGWQVPWSTCQHWPPTFQHVSHYRSTLCQHINIIFTCQHKSTKHVVVCAIMTTFLKIIKYIPLFMLCHMQQLIFTCFYYMPIKSQHGIMTEWAKKRQHEGAQCVHMLTGRALEPNWAGWAVVCVGRSASEFTAGPLSLPPALVWHCSKESW